MGTEPTQIGTDQGQELRDALARWAAAVAEVLGTDVLRELLAFSRTAGPGAMITIRRTRDGFTAQVTAPIVGGPPRPVTPDSIEELMPETT